MKIMLNKKLLTSLQIILPIPWLTIPSTMAEEFPVMQYSPRWRKKGVRLAFRLSGRSLVEGDLKRLDAASAFVLAVVS
jgi:hypothetical protein